MGVAAAIAALSMRLSVGAAASVAAKVLALPEFVNIYHVNKPKRKNDELIIWKGKLRKTIKLVSKKARCKRT